jgi:hypothetical protein
MRGERHRLRSRNEPNADRADCCGYNGILREAKESAAGGSVHGRTPFFAQSSCYAVCCRSR